MSRHLPFALAPAGPAAYAGVMVIAVFNIAMGLAMLAGGLSGKLTLFGTSSSSLLGALGGVVAALGLYQLVSRLRGR
jgi:hypothetical protein